MHTRFLEKVKDEKFNKLKDVYVKLRNDHIQKLREMAEVEKKSSQILKQVELLEQKAISLELTIASMKEETAKNQEKLQKSSEDKDQELEALKKDKDLFNMETEVIFSCGLFL